MGMQNPKLILPIRESAQPREAVLKGLQVVMLLAAGFAFPLCFSGCYTQLYTRGYAERSAADYPEYSRAPRSQADTAAPDPGYATSGDSAVAERESDTLYRPSGPNTVVVNNYYQDSPYYRGYLINDWDYPSISFGIYSSRYRDYTGAYWWNDPWYRSDRGYHSGYYRDNGGYTPSGGGGNHGPYASDKRIFTLPSNQPALHKGRRSRSEAAPVPKNSSEAGSSSSNSTSSSSSSASGGGSTSSGSNSSASGSSEKQDPQEKSQPEKPEHPALNKGRRR